MFRVFDKPPLYYIVSPLFPDPYLPYEDGLIGVSSSLRLELGIAGYSQGFFVWYEDINGHFHWFVGDKKLNRMFLFPGQGRWTRKLRQKFRSPNWEIEVNGENWEEIIRLCGTAGERGEDGSWINESFIRFYREVREQLGGLVTIGVYYKGELAGGLYGLWIGNYFSGESMFHLRPDGSKLALLYLTDIFAPAHNIPFIDCQIPNPYLAQMGGVPVPVSKAVPMIRWASGWEGRKREVLGKLKEKWRWWGEEFWNRWKKFRDWPEGVFKEEDLFL